MLLAATLLLMHLLFANFSNVTTYTNATDLAEATANFTGNFTIVAITPTSGSNTTNVSVRSISSILVGAIKGSPAILLNTLIRYGYTALFLLMLLDASGVPPPSELIMPPAGYLARTGYLNFGAIFLVLMLANAIGATIDYALGYYLGEGFVRRHLRLLSLRERDLDAFELWFKQKGTFAVFIGRMLPIVRVMISIPAGIAKMPYTSFILFSMMGAAIYNYLLMLFGYFLISENASLTVVAALGGVLLILYLRHRFRPGRKKGSTGLKEWYQIY